MNVNTDGLGSELNGIIGLTHNPSAFDYIADGPFATSYLQEMVDANILDKAVFALALRPTEDAGTGWIDMGYYDNMAMENPDDLMWIDSVNDEWLDDFWW